MNYEFKGTSNWRIRFFDKSDPDKGFFIEADSVNGGMYNTEVLGDDFGDHNGYTTELRMADAKLISKAPEMFELLKECLNCFEALNTDSIMCANIKQLLKEATEL